MEIEVSPEVGPLIPDPLKYRLTIGVNDSTWLFDRDNLQEKMTTVGFAQIDRRSGKWTITTPVLTLPNGAVNTRSLLPCSVTYPVCCFLGVLKLLSGRNLVIVTQKRAIGKIGDHLIEQIVGVQIIPQRRTPMTDATQLKTEEKYISLVTNLLCDGSFYFSYTLDLTNTQQRIEQRADVDKRFVWNWNMIQEFLDLTKMDSLQGELKSLKQWCVPVIRGFVGLNQCTIGSSKVEYALITRRSWERAGRRYTKRGASKCGSVTNFCETEQIIRQEGVVTSFVQVRGSIPVLWSQKPNLAYDPPILVKNPDSDTHCEVSGKHFEKQIKIYSKQTVVSLIKKTGGESKLGDTFSKAISQVTTSYPVNYIEFDLHNEVGHTNFAQLQKLWDITNPIQDDYGFFFKGNGMVREQQGVMRTNCKDNLDRTNLVMSGFAAQTAWKQFTRLGITCEADDRVAFQKFLNVVWADNGDAISIQYAGTPAIRSDFIRTGVSTFRGLFNDGMSSVTRYIINNFEDGANQDAIDLLLQVRCQGAKQLPKAYIPEIKDPKKLSTPLALLVKFLLIVFKATKPADYEGFNFILMVIWMTFVLLVWKILKLDHRLIVNQPILKTNEMKAIVTTKEEPKDESNQEVKED